MSIKGWLRRNSTLMAQAKDLARQLQEAWEKYDCLAEYIDGQQKDFDALDATNDYISAQLTRLARSRYEERERRLAAEDKLAEMYESERPENILARYLEELENEEE